MRFRRFPPLFALLVAPGAALCQQTVVRADGSQLHGQVQRVAADRIDLLVTSGLRKGPSSVPCSEVLCVVDGALKVHTRPCGEPLASFAQGGAACNALVRVDQQVLKGTIVRWDDDRLTIRTAAGDVNVPRSELAGVLSPGLVEFTAPADRLKGLLADAGVVSALNDASRCPPVAEPRTVRYSEKWIAPRFERTVSESGKAELDFTYFKDVALEKTRRLSGYIAQITNKELSAIVKDKAVEQAIGLFERPDNLVHVSNVASGASKAHPVHKYLSTHLRYLKYDAVTIEWADIQYVSDFELQPDGSYTAVVSLQQRFQGMVDGQVYYSDITNKNIQIKLRTYEKVVEGRTERLWDVFLGDIGVVSTMAE